MKTYSEEYASAGPGLIPLTRGTRPSAPHLFLCSRSPFPCISSVLGRGAGQSTVGVLAVIGRRGELVSVSPRARLAVAQPPLASGPCGVSGSAAPTGPRTSAVGGSHGPAGWQRLLD